MPGKDNKSISAEVRRKDRSGEYRYCELIGIFYKDREGISEKMMLTYRDTDELAKARIRERQANRRFVRAVNESYDEIYEGNCIRIICGSGKEKNRLHIFVSALPFQSR